MALTIPSCPIPYSTTPATNAYAWIAFLAIDFVENTGRVQVNINLDIASASANLPPIDSFSVALGSTIVEANLNANPPVQAVMFPDLDTLVTNAAMAAQADKTLTPFDAVRKSIYDALLTHPKFKGATEVTD